MVLRELEAILEDCKFPTLNFLASERAGELVLQIEWLDEDNSVTQKSRKWLISAYSTKSEVVQTLFKAIITAMEHEARELFTYKGKAVYGPHFDVDDLAQLVEYKVLREDKRA